MISTMRFCAAILSLSFMSTVSSAQGNSVEAFYQGRTVEMIVSSEVGGGYDSYARVVATFLGQHIPGQPRFIVKNMVGAGGLIAANYLARIAPKDGSVIAVLQNTVPFQPLIAPGGEQFDATKLGYIGSANSEVALSFTWHKSSTQTFDDLLNRETLMAGVIGSISSNYANALRDLVGARIKLITGYAGASQALLAMERGEIEGHPAIFWSTFKATKPEWILEKKVNFLVQLALKKHPELPDVPLILDYLKNADDRAAAELLLAPQLAGRPFVAPPAVPNERLAALQKAFMETMADPDLVNEAMRRKMEFSPINGNDLAALVTKAYASSPTTIARVKSMGDSR